MLEIILFGFGKQERAGQIQADCNDFRHRQHSMRTVFGSSLILCSLCVLVNGRQAVLDSQAVVRRETAIPSGT